jgi:hypothetical protein
MFLGQLILFLLMVILVLFLLLKRRQGMDRLLLFIFMLIGIVSIWAPGLTTRIANLVGIGRGVDLVIYLFIIFNLFFVVYMLSEHNQLLRMITALVREVAMINAQIENWRGTDGSREDDSLETKAE